MTDRSPLPPAPDRSGATGRPEAEENRSLTNIRLVIGFLALVGGGIWLVDAMLDARRADECMSSGRRNCNPLPVNPQQLR
jgi:hypothetical protein